MSFSCGNTSFTFSSDAVSENIITDYIGRKVLRQAKILNFTNKKNAEKTSKKSLFSLIQHIVIKISFTPQYLGHIFRPHNINTSFHELYSYPQFVNNLWITRVFLTLFYPQKIYECPFFQAFQLWYIFFHLSTFAHLIHHFC